jgi:DNA ligase (NAD+)
VRQLDSKKVADKPLDIFVYEILNTGDMKFDYHHEVRKNLKAWGFNVNAKAKKCKSFKEIKTYFSALADERESLSYEIDGMVIKLDDLRMRNEFGTRERNPRWAFAWKFQPKKEVTTLRNIVVQVGRTGILTPVALLDPVEIGGVTVSRASLHNEQELKKKDVRPGDKVRVERAGYVIPEVAERVEKSKKRGKAFSMPKRCPVCNTEVVQEGAYTICPAGWSCKAQLKGRIEHFASKKAMNIESLGEKVVAQLVDNKLVNALPDLYRLEKDALKKLDGFADKSAGKLKGEIEKSKQVSLRRYLYALGIRHVGEHVARLLADEFQDFDAVREASYNDLVNISEIGHEIAESIKHFFSAKENQKSLKDMHKLGVEIQSAGGQQSLLLDGLTIVLTGELDNYTRDEAKEKIEKLGGNATSSVSDNTDYLVKGSDPGSKLEDAKKHDVKVIDEDRFMSLLKNGSIE